MVPTQANRSCFLHWESSLVQTPMISLTTIWWRLIWQVVLPPYTLPSSCKCLRRSDEESTVGNCTRAITATQSSPVRFHLVWWPRHRIKREARSPAGAPGQRHPGEQIIRRYDVRHDRKQPFFRRVPRATDPHQPMPQTRRRVHDPPLLPSQARHVPPFPRFHVVTTPRSARTRTARSASSSARFCSSTAFPARAKIAKFRFATFSSLPAFFSSDTETPGSPSSKASRESPSRG